MALVVEPKLVPVMTRAELARVLRSVPEAAVLPSAALTRGIAESLAYLGSEAALQSIELDPYWPKWNSPWWHALLLFELGEGARLPARVATAFVERLDRLPLHIFPIQPSEFSPHTDPLRDIVCHCALGSIVQVLAECGVDLPRALPWVGAWFSRYQLGDGGLNCDNLAYLVVDECPSSMVGTIAPFEALCRLDAPGRDRFVSRGAQFLVQRCLTRGSDTAHNAEERSGAEAWPELTFPRFYHYDTLRGLAALVHWADAGRHALPLDVVAPTAVRLAARFPDGVARVERRAFADHTTIHPGESDARWPASSFRLLEASSELGSASPALTAQWSVARNGLLRLLQAGLISG